jgi:hypothetical protein
MNGALVAGIGVLTATLAWGGMALDVNPEGARLDDIAGALSLRVSDEAAPAGSIVQIKIDVTEPKPISTGRGKIKIRGLTTVQGIALMNHNQDTFGVALLDGDDLSFFINSPSSLFGTPADYPIVTIAGTVSPGAGLGSTFPIRLDPSALQFVNPGGVDYPIEIKDGQLTVANVVVIGDVSPGSSTVPAGGIVRVSGTNFVPDTRLQLSETAVAETRYINSHRIDVVLGQTTDMHGVRIRARNPDQSEATYFSYERTTPMTPSNDPILSRAIPLFAPATFTTATVPVPRPVSRKHRAVGHTLTVTAANAATASNQAHFSIGLALQNLGPSNVSASIELLDSFGNPYATNTVTIGPDRYLVREIGEVFGTVLAPSAFRVKSALPLQVLGIVADHSANSARAVPPG